jgi:hypothetical protein
MVVAGYGDVIDVGGRNMLVVRCSDVAGGWGVGNMFIMLCGDVLVGFGICRRFARRTERDGVRWLKNAKRGRGHL